MTPARWHGRWSPRSPSCSDEFGAVSPFYIQRPQTEGAAMLKDSNAFNGFAVDDLEKAKEFYGETLGVKVTMLDEENGLAELHVHGDQPTLMYAKPDLKPSNNTILNWQVEDIDAVVDALSGRAGSFQKYEHEKLPQEE